LELGGAGAGRRGGGGAVGAGRGGVGGAGGKAAEVAVDAAAHADEVVDVARLVGEAVSHADEAADAARAAERIIETSRDVERIGTELRSAGQAAYRGPRAGQAQELIDEIVQNELANVRLSHYPEFDPSMPFMRYGEAVRGLYTRIGPLAVEEGHVETLIAIVHEEMHHRLWARGVPTYLHHPYVEEVAQRFARLKGLK